MCIDSDYCKERCYLGTCGGQQGRGAVQNIVSRLDVQITRTTIVTVGWMELHQMFNEWEKERMDERLNV